MKSLGEDTPPTRDDLDKEQIEQLHAATLQVSGNCFELKKLCATVLVGAGALVASFGKHHPSIILVGGLGVVLLFWVADSHSYFIQSKPRRRMQEIRQARVERHATLLGDNTEGVGLPIAQVSSTRAAVRRAFLNGSMLYYAMIATILGLAWAISAGGG